MWQIPFAPTPSFLDLILATQSCPILRYLSSLRSQVLEQMLPAGNFGKEKRKEKVAMTERFQLHNMIFCFIEARIDQCVYYYPSNKKVRFQCPTSSRLCVCVPLHKAKPRTLSKREESDGFRSHLLIPYHFHSLFRTSQEHPPEILSSLLHTFDLTLIRFSNNWLSRGSWK